jgi:hypothetical protein
MTVGELIARLNAFDFDEEVCISSEVSEQEVNHVGLIDEHRESRLMRGNMVHCRWVKIS